LSNLIAVTDQNFESEIEKHTGVAVVDFWATWCHPCRVIAPILEELSTEFEGKLKIAKLDVDTNVKTSARFDVRSIPTLLFFRDGKVIDKVVGTLPRPALKAKFQEYAS